MLRSQSPVRATPIWHEYSSNGGHVLSVCFFGHPYGTCHAGVERDVSGQSQRVYPRHAHGHSLLRFFGLSFFSFDHIDAGIASVILFTYPLFVALISWMAFKEKLGWVTSVSILLAFMGLALLSKNGDGKVSLLGLGLALAAGLTYALYQMWG
ncbi:MAG: DMT family transporter [Prevotella sp.]|nr:DMT family transporter [Prevotella sp.]